MRVVGDSLLGTATPGGGKFAPEGRPGLGTAASFVLAGEFVLPLPSLDTGDGKPLDAPALGMRSIDLRADACANGSALLGKGVFVMGDSYCTRFESILGDVAEVCIAPAAFARCTCRCPSLTALDLFLFAATAGFCVCAGTASGTYPCIHLFCR